MSRPRKKYSIRVGDGVEGSDILLDAHGTPVSAVGSANADQLGGGGGGGAAAAADAAAFGQDANILAGGPADMAKRQISIRGGEQQFIDSDKARIEASRGYFDSCVGPKDDRERLYCGNAIVSTKYTWWNFLPKNMFEQLAPWNKPANFYFLCIAVLQSIKAISTTQGRPSILLPLLFVLGVTALKDAFEDRSRGQQDKIKNGAIYEVYRRGNWLLLPSKDILVGDVIRIIEMGRIPADVVIIGSGIENGTHAFIDTKDLDGETNLKPKQVPLCILDQLRSGAQGVVDDLPMEKLNLDINCETPHGDMSEWSADIAAIEIGADGQPVVNRENLSLDQLVLADCVLKNTPWMMGLVVYTGDDTKIRKNMEAQLSNPIYKQTQVFILTKQLFMYMACLQVAVCLIAAIATSAIHVNLKDNAWYLRIDESPSMTGFLAFFTWFIIAKDFLPISLYVSLEMVQFWQAMFMNWDQKMSVFLGGEWIHARAQTSRLNEELAQVHYIFSDKTGTLTQNSMEFKKCIIGRTQYGTGSTEAGVIRRAKNAGEDINLALEQFHNERENQAQDRGMTWHHVEFNQDQKLRHVLAQLHSSGGYEGAPESIGAGAAGSADKDAAHAREVDNFLLCMAVNNSVFPKVYNPDAEKEVSMVDAPAVDINDPNNGVTMQMDSSSPDEKALTYFAQYAGYELYSRQGGRIRVRMSGPAIGGAPPVFRDFQEVCLLDFSSKRKRMTVLVRSIDNKTGEPFGPIKVFCKGADSFVLKLLDGVYGGPGADGEGAEAVAAINQAQPNWGFTFNRLVEFGGESLRTLVVASAEVPAEWWFGPGGFKEQYEETQRNVGETEKGHVDGSCASNCRMCAIETAIETGTRMNLIGATAIEDKLQDGVGETLKSLLTAGIKIWVLTGDNVATAINIGISCNLLEADMENEGRLFLFDKDVADIDLILQRVEESQNVIQEFLDALPAGSSPPSFGVALHGDVWKKILEGGKDLEKKFFDLASKCRSVIACRLEPKEKADIVAAMKEREKVTCLAIGDGNNDTPMIKTAHVGVGIRGVEGTSAVAAADYAISQFRFLRRLLLVYGRLNYRRIAMATNYIFYKTSIMVWTIFFFGAYSAFSGQFLYLDWAYQLYNVAFTAIPILIFAVMDRDLKTSTLEDHPHIYRFTRGDTHFNSRLFFSWILWGFMHGCLCFFIPFFAFCNQTSPEASGQTFGVWSAGLVVYACVVIATNLRIAIFFANWTWLHHLSIWGSVLSFMIFMVIFSSSSFWALSGADYFYVFFRLLKTDRFWLVLLLTCTCCFLLDFFWEAVTRVFWPTSLSYVYIEAERKGMDLSPIDQVAELVPSHRRGVINRGSRAASAAGAAAGGDEEEKELQIEAEIGARYTGFAFSHTPSVRDIYHGVAPDMVRSNSILRGVSVQPEARKQF